MKEIDELLRMTERPQDYSDEELRQMMNDPEMRVYYELMVSAEAGFALRRENEEDGSRDSAPQNHGSVPMIFRIAAIFIGVLLLSGISFAAWRLVVGGKAESQTKEAVLPNSSQLSDSPQQETAVPSAIRTFENVELQQILQELSDYYHVSVEFRNEQSRHIRLYTKWDTAAPLQQIIELLNGFEKVSVRLVDNQIIAD